MIFPIHNISNAERSRQFIVFYNRPTTALIFSTCTGNEMSAYGIECLHFELSMYYT